MTRRTCGRIKYHSRSQISNYSTNFRLKNLKEKGMLQYFYHSPSSELPIRDVLGENKIERKSVGKKTEL